MFTKTIPAMKQMQLRLPQTGIILLLLIFQAEVFPGQVRARPGVSYEELPELPEGLQWLEILNKQQVMQLDSFPRGFSPIIQPIDTWFLSRKLGPFLRPGY